MSYPMNMMYPMAPPSLRDTRDTIPSPLLHTINHPTRHIASSQKPFQPINLGELFSRLERLSNLITDKFGLPAASFPLDICGGSYGKGMGGRTPTEEEGYRMKELENLRLLYRKTKSCICTIQSSSHLPYSDHQLTLASHGLTALLMLIKNHIGTVTSYLRFRTEWCRRMNSLGGCLFQLKGLCRFAHSESEKRILPPLLWPLNAKTEPCQAFSKQGVCPYGDRCCFIHDESEVELEKLRQMIAANNEDEKNLSHDDGSMKYKGMSKYSKNMTTRPMKGRNAIIDINATFDMENIDVEVDDVTSHHHPSYHHPPLTTGTHHSIVLRDISNCSSNNKGHVYHQTSYDRYTKLNDVMMNTNIIINETIDSEMALDDAYQHPYHPGDYCVDSRDDYGDYVDNQDDHSLSSVTCSDDDSYSDHEMMVMDDSSSNTTKQYDEGYYLYEYLTRSDSMATHGLSMENGLNKPWDDECRHPSSTIIQHSPTLDIPTGSGLLLDRSHFIDSLTTTFTLQHLEQFTNKRNKHYSFDPVIGPNYKLHVNKHYRHHYHSSTSLSSALVEAMRDVLWALDK